MDYQREYFIDGDEANLKRMVLKDIAEKTGFDISTISRVVNSKYIETHFGIYSLKYFFSEGLENQEGEEVSTRELKKALQECVANENKRKPLTDDELVEKMTEKGYKVARRKFVTIFLKFEPSTIVVNLPIAYISTNLPAK